MHEYLHQLHRERIERLKRMRVISASPPKPKRVVETLAAQEQLPWRTACEIINRLVCGRYRISHLELVGGKQRRPTRARHVAMYLMRKLLGPRQAPYPTIAMMVGRTDHTTAMNGCRRIAEQLAADSALAGRLHRLAEQCRKEFKQEYTRHPEALTRTENER